jgi:hypothetical protein
MATRRHAERARLARAAQSGEQLVPAEAGAASGREQDADDVQEPYSGSNRNFPSRTTTSTRARSSIPL